MAAQRQERMAKRGAPLKADELGTEPIRALLIKYALPGIIAMTASSLYNIVDSIYIGRGCGSLAFGALTVVVASAAYAGNYFGIIDIEDFLSTANIFATDGNGSDKEQDKGDDKEDALGDLEALSEKATKKMIKTVAVDKSHPAYEVAENILYDLRCDNDIDTAYNIFDTNGHYWNLVQLNGEWYHCDATVFRDRYEMYFMCTDDEIDDGHHDFDHSLYPERASGYSGYQEDWWGVDPDAYNDPYTDDWSDDDWNEWSDDDWNGLTEEDYYNIDVQYDNSNNGYSGELDENVNVYEDDFEDDWN